VKGVLKSKNLLRGLRLKLIPVY